MAEFEQFAAAIAGAAFIATAAAGTARHGCLVGFGTQASIQPPRFLVCISVENATFDVACRASHIGIHLVPADRPDLAQLFGGTTGDDIDKFAGLRCEEGPGGEPLLVECPMRLSGRVLDRHPFGDHVGFLVEPVAVWAVERFEPLDIASVAGIDPGHDP